MVYSVAQARKHLEAKYQEIAKATLETAQRYLDDKGKEIVAEMDAAVKLQAELPMFDLSSYDAVERFSLDWGRQGGAVTLRIGDVPVPVNIVVRAGERYECYFLMRKKPKEGEKPA